MQRYKTQNGRWALIPPITPVRPELYEEPSEYDKARRNGRMQYMANRDLLWWRRTDFKHGIH